MEMIGGGIDKVEVIVVVYCLGIVNVEVIVEA